RLLRHRPGIANRALERLLAMCDHRDPRLGEHRAGLFRPCAQRPSRLRMYVVELQGKVLSDSIQVFVALIARVNTNRVEASLEHPGAKRAPRERIPAVPTLQCRIRVKGVCEFITRMRDDETTAVRVPDTHGSPRAQDTLHFPQTCDGVRQMLAQCVSENVAD